MQLWRLTSPKIWRVSQEAGDPRESMVCFQPQGWQARDAGQADISVQFQRQENANSPV